MEDSRWKVNLRACLVVLLFTYQSSAVSDRESNRELLLQLNVKAEVDLTDDDRADSKRALAKAKTEYERSIVRNVPEGWVGPQAQAQGLNNSGRYLGKDYSRVWNWADKCIRDHAGDEELPDAQMPKMSTYLADYLKYYQRTASYRGRNGPAAQRSKGRVLSEEVWIYVYSKLPARHFYPFIPLFIEWSVVPDFSALTRRLSLHTRFITVVESGCGTRKFLQGQHNFSNIITLSPGGNAHIALPHIFKIEKNRFQWTERHPNQLPSISFRGKVEYEKRIIVKSRRGKNKKAKTKAGLVSSGVRVRMLNAFNSSLDVLSRGGVRVKLTTVRLNSNREAYELDINTSGMVLAPRGFSPTSYRMYEALTSGAIPIYIWDDFPWLPYPCTLDWSKLAVVLHVDELSKWVEELPRFIKSEGYKQMFEAAKIAVPKYFTVKSVMDHIETFLHTPYSSPLGICFPRLPDTVVGRRCGFVDRKREDGFQPKCPTRPT